jgi:hypothetical protein
MALTANGGGYQCGNATIPRAETDRGCREKKAGVEGVRAKDSKRGKSLSARRLDGKDYHRRGGMV